MDIYAQLQRNGSTTVEHNFVPDREAYQMVKQVYAHFGITDPRSISAFDENGDFILE